VATEPTSTTDRPTRPARAAATRVEGQWALGQTEPLNANEAFKRDDDGLNVRHRIETVYAQQGFASIAPDDLRGRMRWWGLYTQRKPGLDGGRTGSLEPHELDDEYFMLRVRSDGGILSPEQLRAIADVSQTYGRDTADITDRQNVQLHWIRIEDVPAIWQRLESVGLTTNEACGDTPRVVLGSPVAGVAADEIIDATPAIEEIVRRYVGDPRFSNLPRKFKSAVSGSPRQDVAHEINDVSFIGVVHPEHGPGFDVYVGGGLSTNPMLAQRLGVWVPLEDVPDVYEAVLSVFRDYGYRRLRTRARLKFLVSDWGAAKVREVMEAQYLGRPMLDGPAAAPYAGRRDHVGVYPQADGLHYVGAAPTVGRVSGTILHAIGDLAERHGSGRVRLTAQQKLVVLDVADADVEPLVEALHDLGLEVRPSEFRRGTMACTGIEFCKLAIVETKGNAAALVAELEDRLPTFDRPLSIHVNGCPNSCARIQVADIGLKGMLVTDADGNQAEGFQVHLGGELGPEAGLGRKPRGLKVSSAELPDYVERVLGRYADQRDGDESFSSWARRADEEALA
jgi:sulfite reductase (ferredoxin)